MSTSKTDEKKKGGQKVESKEADKAAGPAGARPAPAPESGDNQKESDRLRAEDLERFLHQGDKGGEEAAKA